MERHTLELADGSRITGMIGLTQDKKILVIDCGGFIGTFRIKADSIRLLATDILKYLSPQPIENKDKKVVDAENDKRIVDSDDNASNGDSDDGNGS